VAADVAGFSRLIGVDEEGTLAALRAHRLELIDPKILEHGGRIANTAGDSLLIEFPSAVGALRCAIEVQAAMAERNADIPRDQKIDFRIGINVGDVVDQDGDLLGDGVNVAARLEARAEPGGICLSRTVRDQVRDRVNVVLEDLGDVELKNIARPVRVFRVPTGSTTVPVPPTAGLRRRMGRRAAIASVAILLASIAGGVLWFEPWNTHTDRPMSSLSAKTSIAILPFENISRDPGQDYLTDGITNDLITDLSKFNNLFVIASNSVFVYKDNPVDIQQVGRDLGVRYVLEGSVQRHGDRLRINAQLIDAGTGRHLWAERYDEDSADVFELQDKINRRIIRSLAVRLSDAEEDRAFSKPTQSLEAYDYVLRGRALLRKSSRQENFQARELFRQATKLDPDYGAAHAGIGWTYMYPLLYGWTGQPQRALQEAHRFAKTAISKSEDDVEGHKLLARVYLTRHQHDLALVETERIIASNPNDAEGHIEQGYVLFWLGRVNGSILALETALRFDPNMGAEAYWYLAAAHYLKGNFEQAITIAERNLERRDDFVIDYLVLAAAYARSGQQIRAQRAADSVRRLDPFFDASKFGLLFSERVDAERFIDGFRKAGL
jgi:TolB-like protein/class 3 adenylate cyclase/Tfp pilus assembly protein PilF